MSKYLKVDYVNLGLQFKNLEQEITDKFVEISSKGSYVLGEELKDFEELFSEYCGTSYAVGVGNGSDAIFFSWVLSLNDNFLVRYTSIPQ